jgi:NlpC/P60 family putative phage cell wall peptidase
MTRDEVVTEARSWLGTPYAHQAHLRGVGCDCGGLIGGVAVALGIVPADWWETAFAPHAGYATQPHGNSLIDVLDAFMARIDPAEAQPGDVIAMRFRRDPQHVAIVTPLGMVHALNTGRREVVEHGIDAKWRRRVTHAYVMPGVG